ncbi:MAG: toxin-antitoxin system antitoxin subunit [Propionicimonas sp.]|uniref:FitA-like ribbon-helix-helix domain-containing protein n=1 Tax=Propionicimonas sp. TaxID=1955623 RepID=UPI003D13E353
MGTLTIRHLDERTHARLRARAARNGRSVEAEVCNILNAAVNLPEENFLLALHAATREGGGVNLRLEPRSDPPRPVGAHCVAPFGVGGTAQGAEPNV